MESADSFISTFPTPSFMTLSDSVSIQESIMAVPTPEQKFDKDVWVPRFAMRLRAFRPELTGEEAMDLADSEYYISSDTSPEDAAEVYADETPPGSGT